jgi:hypothetical protein
MAPSLFQIMLFYHDASSMWTPEFLNWMPLWMMKKIHYVASYWIAAGLLG